MDKQLALTHIRTIETALKVIMQAVEGGGKELGLKALTDAEQNLAALRQMLEELQAK